MKKTNRINAEVMLTCRMEKVLFDKLTKYAKRAGMTRSQYVRLGMLYVLDTEKRLAENK